MPNYYSYDFRYDIETTKKRTMKITANTVTSNADYYFMFGLESSSSAETSPIDIDFIFVSPSGTTSTYTTGIPTGSSTKSFYNEDASSGSMIQAPFTEPPEYDEQANEDGSIVETDQEEDAAITTQKADSSKTSIGKQFPPKK